MVKGKTHITYIIKTILLALWFIQIICPVKIYADNNSAIPEKEIKLKKELAKAKGPDRLPILKKLMIVSYGEPRQLDYLRLMAKEGEIYDSLQYAGQAYTEECCYFTNNEGLDSVIKYAPIAMEMCERAGNSNFYYLSSSMYSFSLCIANRFTEAISNGFKTYEKAKRDNDEVGLPASCEIIGNIYAQMHVYDEAIRYLKEEMKYFEKFPPNNFSLKLQNYIDLLPLLISEKKYNEALEYCNKFDKDLLIHKDFKNYEWGIRVCRLYIRSARITAYSYSGSYKKAEELLPFTEKDFDGMDEGTFKMCNYSEADYYYCIKNYDKAYASLKKVPYLYDNLPNNIEMFIDVLQHTGHQAEALKSLKDLYYENDSTLNLRITEQLSQFNSQYQLDKLKDENISIKQHEAETTIYLVTTIATLLLIIVCIITYYYRKEHRINGILKHTTADLKAALVKADESNRLKSTFLQNVSHELRTPLNSIVGFASYFSEKEEANEEDKYIANLIGTNSNQLLHMVGELMEMSKLEANAVTFTNMPCNLSKLIPDIIKSLDYEVKLHHGVELKYEIPQDDDIIMNTDEHHLRSIIEHLLDNSLKFTEKGSITISLQRCKDSGKSLIVITDTGCGIPKEKQEEIFNNFIKADDFSKGFGLGLPICRMICENINSTLELDNRYEGGARFIIYLRDIKRN